MIRKLGKIIYFDKNLTIESVLKQKNTILK